jgi:phosphate transport system ATP-binding protein
LRILNRLYCLYSDQHATGDVRLDGRDILGPDVDIQRLRARVGMVFQTPTTFPMSIYDNIAFGIRLHEHLPHAEMGRRVEEALTVAALWGEVKDLLSASAGFPVGRATATSLHRAHARDAAGGASAR